MKIEKRLKKIEKQIEKIERKIELLKNEAVVDCKKCGENIFLDEAKEYGFFYICPKCEEKINEEVK